MVMPDKMPHRLKVLSAASRREETGAPGSSLRLRSSSAVVTVNVTAA